MTENEKQKIILKASNDLGPFYKYTIKNSGLGPALIVDASTKEKASIARKAIQSTYEGLRTIVIYNTSEVDKNEH